MLICAGLFVTFGSPGLADRAALNDGQNDAFGPLDIRRISHGHAGTNRVFHYLSMYERWGRSDLRSSVSEIRILFTTDHDNRPERVLVIDAGEHRLEAFMHKWKKGGPGKKIYGQAALSRPSKRGVRAAFDQALLGNKVGSYGWHVDTRYHDARNHRCNLARRRKVIVCPDSAPNDNSPRSYLVHPM